MLGAKRLIAGKDWEKTQKLVCLHRHNYQKIEQAEQVDVLNRLPAELLVCRLMQRFREAANAWPRSLAITYPTTYDPRELEQLREVVQRAWLRMQSRLQAPGQEEPADPDPTHFDAVSIKGQHLLAQNIDAKVTARDAASAPRCGSTGR